MDDRLITTLLERLDRIEQRLTQLESSAVTKVEPTRPSPVVRPTPPPFPVKSSTPPEIKPQPTRPVPKFEPAVPIPATKQSPSSEYLLGARVLPWAGSILLIICITTFVTIAYRQGFITKEHIFGLATTICLGFIGIGQRLRDTKEEFGHLLTGLGSAGLYITFAAGHFAQNIYSNQVMLGLFVVLSLINLAYSYWRETTAFLIIGGLGGYVAALMPLMKGDIASNLTLAALITIPISLIISRHRWTTLSYLILPLAVGVVSPGLWTPGFEWQKVAYLTLIAAVGSFGYATSWRESELKPNQEVFLPICLSGIAWINFEIIDGPLGSLHTVALGIALAATSRFTPSNTATTRLQQAALFIPLIVAPWGASKPIATMILAALSIGAAVTSQRFQPRTIAVLSVILAGLSVCGYIVTMLQGKLESAPHDMSLLAILTVTIPIAAFSLIKAYPETREYSLTIAGIVTGITTTSFLYQLTTFPKLLPEFNGLLIALTLVATAIHIISQLIDSNSLTKVGVAWTVILLVVTASPVIAMGAPYTSQTPLLNLVVVGHFFLLYRLYVTTETENKESTIIFLTLPAATLIWDSLRQFLNFPSAGFDPIHPGIYAAIITSTAFVIYARRINLEGISIIALLSGHLILLGTFLSRIPFKTEPTLAEYGLIGLSLTLVYFLSKIWSLKDDGTPNPTPQAVATIQTSFFALYAGFITLSAAPFFWSFHRSLIVTAAVIAFVLVGIHFRINRPLNLIPAWLMGAIIGVTVYLTALNSIPAVGILLVVQIALAIAGDKLIRPPTSHRALNSLIGSVTATHLGTLILTSPAFNLPTGPAITTTWAILATLCLITGFSARITELRHTGLTLLFLAAGKVIFFDLASTPELIRVGVTFILGLAMIGGGYLYIRLQSRLAPE